MAEETSVPGQPPSDETVVGAGGSSAAGIDRPGDRVGPYVLLSVLGEGGFGSVWLAERREPFVQQVAVKLIKAGMDSAAVVARFEQERQALAVMNHPNVAKVLDGGLTANGRPYFAMEYVKGKPLNAFADERQLPVRDRLELFVQVCEAVQHAHTKGLIHRDLKPSNVLVHVGTDDRPQAKVIDFGIAKALTQRLTERTIFTMTGEMIGTPEYMSPEQADPGTEDIDTRTDVYSLGVILYELLTGSLPFDSRDLRSRAYREIQRIIREVDPPTPSGRLSTLATRDSERAAIVARLRQQRIDQLAATLRRELEWIPMKAMRKERQERYQSPNDLAVDVRNYLAGLPLVAAPESVAYRARKFVRRNRTAVATSAAFVALLLAATVTSTLFGISESRARALAERRERDVRRVLDFQHRQLAEIGQEEAGLAMFDEISRQFANRLELEGVPAGRRDAAVREFREAIRGVNPTDVAFQLIERVILRRGVAEAGSEYAGDPFVQAGLLESIGRTYLELGRDDEARELFARAAEAFGREFGPGDRRTLAAIDLGLRAAPVAADAVPEAERVLAERRARFGDSDPDALASMRTLAGLLVDANRAADAVAVREALVAAEASAGATGEAQVADLAELGDLYRELGRPDDAVAACRRAKAALDALPQPAPRRLTAHVLGNLGLALIATRRKDAMAEGLAELRKVPAIDDAVDGERHARAFLSRNNLAVRLGQFARPDWGLPDADRAAVAEEERRLLDEIRVKGQGLDLLPDGYYLGIVADAVHRQRNPVAGDDARRAQLAEAMGRMAEAHAVLRARHGDDDETVLKVGGALASLQLEAGDAPASESTYRALIAARTRTLRPGDFKVLDLRADMARSIAAQGRWADAVAELRSAQSDAVRDGRDLRSDARWNVASRLLAFLRRWGELDPAAPAAGEVAAQEAVVAELRGARSAAGKVVDFAPRAHEVP